MERMNNFRGRKVGWRGGTLAAFLLSAATMRGLAQGSRTCSDSPGHPEPFGPTLADSGVTFRGTFSADGREFWFFRKVSADPHAEDYRVFVSRRQEAGWSAPERVDLGGDYSDLYPARSPDGRWLAFTSYRRMPGDTLAKPNAGLWAAEHAADGGWKPPIPLTAATRIGAYQSQPVFGRDGRLYFRRTSPDWDTTTNLVTALFGAPTAYDPAERWMRWRDDLQVWGGSPTPDGQMVLLEVSPRVPGERRGQPSDLWVSRHRGGTWETPVPLVAGVNTEHGWENFATVTPDGCDLVFVRDFSAFYRVSLRAALGDQTP